MPLQGPSARLIHFFGSIWEHSKWFDTDRHAQFMADAYDILVMTVHTITGAL